MNTHPGACCFWIWSSTLRSILHDKGGLYWSLIWSRQSTHLRWWNADVCLKIILFCTCSKFCNYTLSVVYFMDIFVLLYMDLRLSEPHVMCLALCPSFARIDTFEMNSHPSTCCFRSEAWHYNQESTAKVVFADLWYKVDNQLTCIGGMWVCLE